VIFALIFFSHSLEMCRLFSTVTEKVNFHVPKFLTTFFSHSPEFSPVLTAQLQLPSTNVQLHTKISYDLFYSFPRNLSFFTPVFNPHTYKVTTTTAQFTFYNCKWHLTTAEIVISYTLKYALLSLKVFCRSVFICLWRQHIRPVSL